MDCIYHARATNLDFMGASDDARKTINSWVEQKTSQKIKDLIPPPYIDPSTCLVLTNAIYFKGTWVKEFDKSLTRDEKFFSGDGRTVNVPMMRRLDEDAKFDYLETEDMQMLQMPYIGEKLSLVILLPKEHDIAPLESSLAVEKLAQWREGPGTAARRCLHTQIQDRCQILPDRELDEFGNADRIRGDADFSGISAGGGLFISAVIHQAHVDVNEEGTEAAAATAVIMSRSDCGGSKDARISCRPSLHIHDNG